MHWRKAVLGAVSDQLWRHNQAGDLPGRGNKIDLRLLAELVAANRQRRGFTYTHKPLTAANVAAIMGATRDGFTVNVSANSPAHGAAKRRAGNVVGRS